MIALIAGGEAAASPPSNRECAVLPNPNWTTQETFVWSRVCVGLDADFTSEPSYGGVIDPHRPEGLPNDRILTSDFIETILLNEKYRHALTRIGVVIVVSVVRDFETECGLI